MKITLNNTEQVIEPDNINISQLLEIKNFTWKLLVIKVNDRLIKRHEYDTVHVKEGDNVSVIHLITGG
ncbi:MAG: sulfur carrier protein ThiS [Chloroflexota bacterium]|nr:sulfur carrier protein ThiS [Lentimicrobium sp.]